MNKSLFILHEKSCYTYIFLWNSFECYLLCVCTLIGAREYESHILWDDGNCSCRMVNSYVDHGTVATHRLHDCPWKGREEKLICAILDTVNDQNDPNTSKCVCVCLWAVVWQWFTVVHFTVDIRNQSKTQSEFSSNRTEIKNKNHTNNTKWRNKRARQYSTCPMGMWKTWIMIASIQCVVVRPIFRINPLMAGACSVDASVCVFFKCFFPLFSIMPWQNKWCCNMPNEYKQIEHEHREPARYGVGGGDKQQQRAKRNKK